MTPDEHATNIGKLLSNLQSLELLLRIFLCEHNHEDTGIPSTQDVEVPLTHLTNYDVLNVLVEKYNRIALTHSPNLAIDGSVVLLRDTLAHGRVLSSSALPPMRIFKFGRPNGATVTKVFDEVLDDDWFNRNGNFVHDQMTKVRTFGTACGFPSFQ